MITHILKRVRGLALNALWWGAVWGALGTLGTWLVAALTPTPAGAAAIELAPALPWLALWWSVQGMAAGLLFGVVFIARERARRFDELGLNRTTRWGALAGAALPALSLGGAVLSGSGLPPDWALALGVGVVGGAVSARMTLQLARRADLTARATPELAPRAPLESPLVSAPVARHLGSELPELTDRRGEEVAP